MFYIFSMFICNASGLGDGFERMDKIALETSFPSRISIGMNQSSYAKTMSVVD